MDSLHPVTVDPKKPAKMHQISASLANRCNHNQARPTTVNHLPPGTTFSRERREASSASCVRR